MRLWGSNAQGSGFRVENFCISLEPGEEEEAEKVMAQVPRVSPLQDPGWRVDQRLAFWRQHRTLHIQKDVMA